MVPHFPGADCMVQSGVNCDLIMKNGKQPYPV
jgi:hypothetical protein